MDTPAAAAVFEALASGLRLEVFRLLVRAGPTGRVAGELAAALDVAPNKLSFHLKALQQAGLVSVVAEGRYQRYRATIPRILEVIDYLTAECCEGRPEQCAGLRSARCAEAASGAADAVRPAPAGARAARARPRIREA